MGSLARIIQALVFLRQVMAGYEDGGNLPYTGRGGRVDAARFARKQAEEMNKMRSRNRDEMTSEQYNQQILSDELIEETHTSEENLDGYLSDDEINKIWAEHMHDFVPEDMTNLLI